MNDSDFPSILDMQKKLRRLRPYRLPDIQAAYEADHPEVAIFREAQKKAFDSFMAMPEADRLEWLRLADAERMQKISLRAACPACFGPWGSCHHTAGSPPTRCTPSLSNPDPSPPSTSTTKSTMYIPAAAVAAAINNYSGSGKSSTPRRIYVACRSETDLNNFARLKRLHLYDLWRIADVSKAAGLPRGITFICLPGWQRHNDTRRAVSWLRQNDRAQGHQLQASELQDDTLPIIVGIAWPEQIPLSKKGKPGPQGH